MLRGPRFRRVSPDVYVPATCELDLAVRSVAASVYVGRRGVLVGYSAAELHGAPCAGRNAPAEVSVPGGAVRSRADLRVHRFRLDPAELTQAHGCTVTTAERATYDLGRQPDRTEGVVALDALTHQRVSVEAVLAVAAAIPATAGFAGCERRSRCATRGRSRRWSPGSGSRCTGTAFRRRPCSIRWVPTGSTSPTPPSGWPSSTTVGTIASRPGRSAICGGRRT